MSARRRAGRTLAAACLGLLLGCVYYNGMYNTKRLAGSAWKAEREGRTFEATNLWGQVITRAESLVVRHPDSKYVDEAMVLKGIAHARLGQCADAVGPLARVSVVRAEGQTAEEAALALGRCQMEMGDPAAAELAFAQVLQSDDPARRRDARLHHARALRRLGRAEEAVAALDGLGGPRVAEERLVALGATGREAEALALADSLLARSDSARNWDSLVAGVGRSNPRSASALVERLGRQKAPADLHARRLYDDGVRLDPVDTARATRRFLQAARLGGTRESGVRAGIRLLRRQAAGLDAPGPLAPIADSLDRLGDVGVAASQEARQLALTIRRVHQAADSSGPGTAEGDLRLFLAAEAARDSLQAPGLAAALFRQLVESWTESPYAPKALLAGRLLDPQWGEAMRPMLEERYAASPYMAILRGEEADGYRQLEDSLQAFALGAAARPRQAEPGGRRPTTPGDPAERPDRPRPRRGVEP